MTLAEPVDVLFETGDSAVFAKADGSGVTVPTKGLLENGEVERPSGETTVVQNAWQFTCPTAAVADFGEDDTVTINSATYEILDIIARDSSVTVFLLSDPT